MLYLYEKAVNNKDICGVFTTNSVPFIQAIKQKVLEYNPFQMFRFNILHHKFINI